MSDKNITPAVWQYLREEKTKIAKRILDALDYDICYFYSDGWSITLEKTWSGARIPDYLFNYIKKHEQKILTYAREAGNE